MQICEESARDVDTLICSEGMRVDTALTWPRQESIKWLLRLLLSWPASDSEGKAGGHGLGGERLPASAAPKLSSIFVVVVVTVAAAAAAPVELSAR